MPEQSPDSALRDGIAALTEPQRKAVRAAVSTVLETQRTRIEYAESRRAALATVGGVVLAAGLAGLLVVAEPQNWDYFPAWLGLLCITSGLVLTGVVVLVVYGRQTNWHYPFKSLTTTWKHFYRDAIPGAGEPKVPWYAGQSNSFKVASARGFTDLFPDYVDRVLSLEDSGIDLSQDVAQSYVLHWNEMYKNRFLSSLRMVVVVGIVSTIALGGVGFLAGLILAPHRYDHHGERGERITIVEQQ